jgi:hypothetical protein
VLSPLTQIQPGLFRFAIAGRPRDLAGTIEVDVTYAGVSLGKRTLPVGWDTWSASDPAVDVAGACATGAGGARSAGSSSGGLRACALLVLVLVVAARRRRRLAGVRVTCSR